MKKTNSAAVMYNDLFVQYGIRPVAEISLVKLAEILFSKIEYVLFHVLITPRMDTFEDYCELMNHIFEHPLMSTLVEDTKENRTFWFNVGIIIISVHYAELSATREDSVQRDIILSNFVEIYMRLLDIILLIVAEKEDPPHPPLICLQVLLMWLNNEAHQSLFKKYMMNPV
jgi:adenosine deaminase